MELEIIRMCSSIARKSVYYVVSCGSFQFPFIIFNIKLTSTTSLQMVLRSVTLTKEPGDQGSSSRYDRFFFFSFLFLLFLVGLEKGGGGRDS